MAAPTLWIIAGPNGAGKTTLVSKSMESFGLTADAFINPDAITLAYLKEQGIENWGQAPAEILKATFIRAANDTQKMLEERIESGGTAVIESVLSTPKYCELVERVLALGGELKLIYVALRSSTLSKQRVAIRVAKGGHGVPADKLDSRWLKSLELLPWFAIRASQFWIIDNSNPERVTGGHLLVSGHQHTFQLHGIPVGEIRSIVSQFLSRFTAMNSDSAWKLDLDDRYELPH